MKKKRLIEELRQATENHNGARKRWLKVAKVLEENLEDARDEIRLLKDQAKAKMPLIQFEVGLSDGKHFVTAHEWEDNDGHILFTTFSETGHDIVFTACKYLYVRKVEA